MSTDEELRPRVSESPVLPMVGPVLYQEFLLGGRRNRQYVFRWVYAGWLVFQLLVIFFLATFGKILVRSDESITAAASRSFTTTFVVQQFFLLVLATPAITAGAVTDEKKSGTLQYLLTTDLTAWQILAGKLLGRTAQVAVLALTGLPVLCFIGVFGGLELPALLGLVGVSVPPLFALGAASLLASVWTRQTRDAVLGLYAAGGLGLLLLLNPGGYLTFLGLGPLLNYFNPLYVLEPAWGQPDRVAMAEFGRRLLGSTLAWGTILAACLALAAWRLRPTYVVQLENAGRAGKPRWWRAARAPVDDEPLRWKERHVEGMAPLAWLRNMPRWAGFVAVALTTAAACLLVLWSHRVGGTTLKQLAGLATSLQVGDLLEKIQPAGESFYWLGAFAMIGISLLVGIRCSGAVSGEREKQCWEALLLTPLTVQQLVRGKLWGILGTSWPFLVAFAAPALALAWLGGLAAFLWTLMWSAVTWEAMYFVGAAGIWCSVRARSSWRALLGTVGWAYVGGFLIFVVLSPLILVVALLVWALLLLVDALFNTAFGAAIGAGVATYGTAMKITACLALAGVCFGLAKYFLADAQNWVANRERTKHWKDEPRRLRRRGRRGPGRPWDEDLPAARRGGPADDGWRDSPHEQTGIEVEVSRLAPQVADSLDSVWILIEGRRHELSWQHKCFFHLRPGTYEVTVFVRHAGGPTLHRSREVEIRGGRVVRLRYRPVFSPLGSRASLTVET